MGELETILLGTEPLTHLGNAERIAAIHKEKIIYNHIDKKWLFWNGIIWKEDTKRKIFKIVQKEARSLALKAESVDDDKLRAKIKKWAELSENEGNIRSTQRILRGIEGIAGDALGWDNKPMLFACSNGIIDLTTGDLLPSNSQDMLTMMGGDVAYDPKAICPEWEKFLDDVFEGNNELIHWLQKCIGYTLTGNASEKAIFMCYGWGGDNGKSTFIGVLKHLMGDYWIEAADKVFEYHKNETQTNDLAALKNKRLVTWEEAGDGVLFNEKNAKRLSGNETQINARGLYKESSSFRPVCKIWMSFNQQPRVKDQSPAFWKRINMIHFQRTFDRTKNQDIGDRLKKEAQGILRWAVEGCLMWQQEGLGDRPELVIAATEEYRVENDLVQQWINEQCNLNPQFNEQASSLFDDFEKWAKKQGLSDKEIGTQHSWGKKMKYKFKKVRTSVGYFYQGIEIKKSF